MIKNSVFKEKEKLLSPGSKKIKRLKCKRKEILKGSEKEDLNT